MFYKIVGVQRDVCKQFFSSEFFRILKKTFLLEHTWEIAANFIFDIFKSNKYRKLVFYLPFVTESKTK